MTTYADLTRTLAFRLSGTRLTCVEHRGPDLALRLEGVVRFGLLGLTAVLVCKEVTAITGTNVRAPTRTEVLRPGGTTFVSTLKQQPGHLEFELRYPTGPGDADYHHFVVLCRAVRVSWRPSLRGTLRAWARI